MILLKYKECLYFTDTCRGGPAGSVLCPGWLCPDGGLLHGLCSVWSYHVGPQVCVWWGAGQKTVGINWENCYCLWGKITKRDLSSIQMDCVCPWWGTVDSGSIKHWMKHWLGYNKQTFIDDFMNSMTGRSGSHLHISYLVRLYMY